MRIISFIEDRAVIQAILKHLGLWLPKSKPAPKAHAPPARNQQGSGTAGYISDSFSQLPLNDDPLYRDPDYPWEAYFQFHFPLENHPPSRKTAPQTTPTS